MLSFFAGATASFITGSGTWREVMARRTVPSVKVSPDEHSTPKSATMSPADALSTSSSSLECILRARQAATSLQVLQGLLGGGGRRGKRRRGWWQRAEQNSDPVDH